ncbi:hypothetical protein [Hymenobacter crusticola]|uniref:Uncharacterized protein n=1 Tax=Hymenobacter crusticola TaxID=1770526 RepID=A0A243W9V5_9BACT|nr:hypothetical protein [Hymenobacter crusticola]OUJ72145.1 hypothetical protein BXP70_19325 [Hymenobacter crusticola]
MRRLFSYTLFLSVVLASATACTKEEAAPPAEPFFSVNQDGKAWEPATTTTYKSGNAFYLVSNKAAEANQRQELYLGFTVTNLRKPSVRLFSTVWTHYAAGKTVRDQYVNTDDLSASSLQITRLDTVQKVIEGRFDATIQRSTVYSQQKERMQLTEGSFRVSYRDTLLPAYTNGR